MIEHVVTRLQTVNQTERCFNIVAGAAEFAEVSGERPPLAYPACYVVPLAEDVVNLAALSRMRQVSVELFDGIGKAASNYMVLAGTDFPAASAELSEYLKAPTEGAKKFADAWGGLSVAQLDAIESMDRSGNRLGAQRELLAAMETRLKDLAKVGRTEIQQASDSMGKSWDDMLTKLSRTAPIVAAREALIGLFRGVAAAASEASLEDQIAELDRKLANPPVLGARPDGTPIYDRGRADYVDARRRRDNLELQRQARDAASFNEAEAFSFGPRQGANDNGLPDPTRIKELIASYDELATRRKALMDQMTLMSRAAGQEGVDQAALSRALQNLMGQYDALKDPIDQARDALSAEQRVAASSIGTRQVLQAQIQAEQAALQAGQPAWKAEELGKIAAAQATVQLITAARDQVVLSADEAKGALTVASAYLQGARAASQATIAEEARQAAVRNAFVDEQALTAALTARAAAQATIGGAKAVAELQQRVEATERLAEAEKTGAAAVSVTAGRGDGAGAGGHVNLTGGDTGTGSAGDVRLFGGTPTGAGAAGDVALWGGDATVMAGQTAGAVTIVGGSGGSANDGGNVSVTAGSGVNGGALSFNSGAATGGAGGGIFFTAKPGVGSDKDGGSITFAAGDATGSGAAGDISFSPGAGGAIYLNGGNVVIFGLPSSAAGLPTGALYRDASGFLKSV